MTRYFEKFYNDDPMIELGEAEAIARGRYVTLEDGLPKFYRRMSSGVVRAIIYAGWDDPAVPLAHFHAGKFGVPAEIYSPVQQEASGHRRWRTWYVTADGQIEKILEPEFFPDGRFVRQRYFDGSGTWINDHVYQYNSNDELYEVTTVAPDGTVLNRHAAPL